MGTTIDETTTPTQLLLPTTTATTKPPPKDKYHLSYLIHFTLGAGYLLPWNAFITAVDYFSYLYPSYSVDRVFSVAYMLTGLLSLLVIIFYPKKSGAHFRINLGLGLFVVCLVVVPVLELVGPLENQLSGFAVTVAAVCLAGVADALVQASLIGSAGELPDRYMQAVVAGTAASGAGYLVPWNAFITAVDYFSYVYPSHSVDRVFSVAYMLPEFFSLLLIFFYPKKSGAHFRINLGSGLFVVSLVVVPGSELVGRVGGESGFGVTVAAVCLAGVADALVEGGLYGSAGELPDRYMQAVVAGGAASGVLVSFLRIFTKAVYPQDAHGLRNSAILYFIVGIVLMVVCLVFHNVAHRLPVMKYYNDLKLQAISDGKQEKGSLSGPIWKLMGEIKWYGAGIVVIYVVTLSIFPGFITEDVHSTILRDWYPILLITSYNVFDLVGKSFTSIYLFENANASIIACFVRLLFYPLYLGCLHGPLFFRTEIPVVLLTCLLGLTNGYFTSVLFILAPKTVQVQHAETTATLMVLFLILGLASGSIVSWFWVL